MTEISGNWDREALQAGVSVTVVFAAPFLVAARIVADNNANSSLAVFLIMVAIIGFVIGAGVAAWRQRCRTPLMHAIVTSGGTFVVVQGVFVIINLIRGVEVRWFNIFFTLTVTVFAGMVGGLLGIALQRRGLVPKR